MLETKRNNSLIKSIPLMALMAAINIVFVLLTTLVPFLLFLIVFVLPLTSVIVTLKCPKKYFLIYAVATVLLCFGVTFWCIDDTIFYVIPSMFSGFIFGLFIQKKVHIVYVILVTTIIQVFCTYASVPLIYLLTNRNIITVFATAFGVIDYIYLDYVVPLFIFFISMIQELFSFLVIKDEIKKFGFAFNYEKTPLLPLILLNIGILSLMVLFAFIYGPISFVLLAVAYLIGAFILIEILRNKNIINYILLGVAVLLSFFLNGVFYSLFPRPFGVLCFGILLLFELIIGLINNCLLKRNNKDTI